MIASQRRGRALLALLGLALLMGSAGCGYTSGHRMPEGTRSVGVAIFRNDTKLPDLERELQGKLNRAVRDSVGARLERPKNADLVIEGRLIDFFGRGGIRNADNELLETGVAIRAEARLLNRSGDELSKTTIGPVSVGFLIEGAEQRDEALQRALSNIADAIVLDLFSPLEPSRELD